MRFIRPCPPARATIRCSFRPARATSAFHRLPSALWGYCRPSSQPMPGAETLRAVTFDTSTTIDCDVCIIGSGAGGGTVAGELTTKGLRTVVLEAGPGDQAPQFTQRELDGLQKLYYQSGLSA